MRILLVVIGIVLIVVGMAPLFAFVVMPATMRSIDEAPYLKSFLQPVLCQSGGNLTSKQVITHDSDGTGYTAYFTCVKSEGQPEEVTGKSWLYGTVGFVVPLLLGILFINVGARRGKSVATTTGSYWQGGSPLVSGKGAPTSTMERMNTLKSALDAGLITQADYDAKYQELLREL